MHRSRRSMCALACAGVTVLGAQSAAVGATARAVGENELVSANVNGTAPEKRPSHGSSVSADGRYVAFASAARHIADGAGRTRGAWHVYLRDLDTQTTTAVDVKPNGRFGKHPGSEVIGSPSISADGRLVAFDSSSKHLVPDAYGKQQNVFVRDVVTGTTVLVSEADRGRAADGQSSDAVISADGSTVVFSSYASNLLRVEAPIYRSHIYRRDLAAGTTSLASVTPAGKYPNAASYLASVSGDGALVTYYTDATDIAPNGAPGEDDVILYDVVGDKSTLVSAPASGNPPNGGSLTPNISADGTAIVFSSDASNLVSGDTNQTADIFCFTVATGRLTKVSHSQSGGASNGLSIYPVVDATGARVAFTSVASNLTAGEDRNGQADVFYVDLSSGANTLVSRTPAGESADFGGDIPSISGDGSVVAYRSVSTDIVDGTQNLYIERVYAYRAG